MSSRASRAPRHPAGKRRERTFTYDAENKLLTGSSPTAISLGYDPTGRLQTAVSGGVTSTWSNAGAMQVGVYSGSSLATRSIPVPGQNALIVNYSGSGASSPLWLLPDERGSIIATSDSTGAAVSQTGYGANGEPASWSAYNVYTGQPAIQQSQLYNFRARAYNPGLGRFMQTDPMGYGRGSLPLMLRAQIGGGMLSGISAVSLPKSLAQLIAVGPGVYMTSSGFIEPMRGQMKLYAYGRNDPINRIDPTGHLDCDLTCGTTASLGVGASSCQDTVEGCGSLGCQDTFEGCGIGGGLGGIITNFGDEPDPILVDGITIIKPGKPTGGGVGFSAPPGTCSAIIDTGGVVAGIGGGIALTGLFVDGSVIGLPEGLTLNAAGGAVAAVGGVIAGVGSLAKLLGICN